jgi:hypothetical protein
MKWLICYQRIADFPPPPFVTTYVAELATHYVLEGGARAHKGACRGPYTNKATAVATSRRDTPSDDPD